MSDEELTIAIPLKEYKELLIIKGKYEELKEQKQVQYIPFKTSHQEFEDNLYEKEVKPYKVTCDLTQHDNKEYRVP